MLTPAEKYQHVSNISYQINYICNLSLAEYSVSSKIRLQILEILQNTANPLDLPFDLFIQTRYTDLNFLRNLYNKLLKQ